MKIPFNRPYVTGTELQYVEELIENIRNGRTISGDGYYTHKVNDFLESRFGVKKVLMTTSCTSALELATHLLDLQHSDEVIVTSFTFTSTVNPVLLVGAKPVFAGNRMAASAEALPPVLCLLLYEPCKLRYFISCLFII